MEKPSSAISSPSAPPHILIIPFPALGHMIALLDLSHLLSLRGISITALVTPKNLRYLSPLLSPTFSSLVLPFPSSSSFENLHDHPAGGAAAAAMSHALSALRSLIVRWATTHSSPPDAIISDFFLGWTQNLATDLKIPRLAFFSTSALLAAVMDRLWLNRHDENSNFPFVSFPDIPGSLSFPKAHIPTLFKLYQEGHPEWELMKDSMIANISSWGVVINTLRELDGAYLEHLTREYGHRRIWAVGPLISEKRSRPLCPSVMSWLDSREKASVVYVSFGSQLTMSAEQGTAIKTALERSGVSFIWCVKSTREKVSTEGKGIVIEGFAPQLEILRHPAVGAFLTHCGWNSLMEGLAAGVELLAWPVQADQFVNAKLFVDEVNAAVKVGERADVVNGVEELAKALAASVAPGKERKAAELKRATAAAVNAEGGASSVDFENLVNALKETTLRRQELSGKSLSLSSQLHRN